MCHAGCWLRGKTLQKMKDCWRGFLSTSVWRGSRGLCGSPAGQQISLAQECLLQVSRVPVEGCEVAVMREGGGRETENNGEPPERHSVAGSCDTTGTQQLVRGVKFVPQHLSCESERWDLLRPFPSLWSPLTHPPRPVQTSYLSPLPLSHTAASPSL